MVAWEQLVCCPILGPTVRLGFLDIKAYSVELEQNPSLAVLAATELVLIELAQLDHFELELVVNCVGVELLVD